MSVHEVYKRQIAEAYEKGRREGLAEGYANGCSDGYDAGMKDGIEKATKLDKLFQPSVFDGRNAPHRNRPIIEDKADDFALGPFHDTGG